MLPGLSVRGQQGDINELLDGHVALEVECFDRMYRGQLKVWHLKKPYASPPPLGQMTQDLVWRLKENAEQTVKGQFAFDHDRDEPAPR